MLLSLKIRTLHYILAAALLLPMVCACSSSDDLVEPTIATSNQFINLQIVVSAGNENTMRAPAGGEDGDGRETGFERENKVEGITFMLYAVENESKDINTVTDETLAFIKYYPVDLDARKNQGISDQEEATYTTGNQPLKGLDLSQTYRVLVVANMDLTKEFNTNSKVTDVRDHVVSQIYEGSNIGVAAEKFVMALADDYKIEFNTPTQVTTTGGAIQVYSFDNIYIERLAARVDFWTKNASYDSDLLGYKYPVYKEKGSALSEDNFVLTAITPFNFNNGTEYLFKRIQSTTTKYLGSEDDMSNTTDYVRDPDTEKKTLANISSSNYVYPLDGIIKGGTTGPKITLSDINENQSYLLNEQDNIIVGYPKENTLLKESPLYYYATGLCIEGDYYEVGRETDETKKKHLVYYGFLRHVGEETGEHIYTIYPKDYFIDEQNTLTGKEKTETGEFPMNFGVVRNNIYRISIDRITEKRDNPEITLRIMVKNWDVFTHDVIYM